MWRRLRCSLLGARGRRLKKCSLIIYINVFELYSDANLTFEGMQALRMVGLSSYASCSLCCITIHAQMYVN